VQDGSTWDDFAAGLVTPTEPPADPAAIKHSTAGFNGFQNAGDMIIDSSGTERLLTGGDVAGIAWSNGGTYWTAANSYVTVDGYKATASVMFARHGGTTGKAYALFGGGPNNALMGVAKSTDFGHNWAVQWVTSNANGLNAYTGDDNHPRQTGKLILDTADGRVYFGSRKGIFRSDATGKNFANITTPLNDVYALSGHKITGMFIDPNNENWMYVTSCNRYETTTPVIGAHKINLSTGALLGSKAFGDAQDIVAVNEGGTTVVYLAAGLDGVWKFSGTDFTAAGNWSDITGTLPRATTRTTLSSAVTASTSSNTINVTSSIPNGTAFLGQDKIDYTGGSTTLTNVIWSKTSTGDEAPSGDRYATGLTVAYNVGGQSPGRWSKIDAKRYGSQTVVIVGHASRYSSSNLNRAATYYKNIWRSENGGSTWSDDVSVDGYCDNVLIGDDSLTYFTYDVHQYYRVDGNTWDTQRLVLHPTNQNIAYAFGRNCNAKRVQIPSGTGSEGPVITSIKPQLGIRLTTDQLTDAGTWGTYKANLGFVSLGTYASDFITSHSSSTHVSVFNATRRGYLKTSIELAANNNNAVLLRSFWGKHYPAAAGITAYNRRSTDPNTLGDAYSSIDPRDPELKYVYENWLRDFLVPLLTSTCACTKSSIFGAGHKINSHVLVVPVGVGGFEYAEMTVSYTGNDPWQAEWTTTNRQALTDYEAAHGIPTALSDSARATAFADVWKWGIDKHYEYLSDITRCVLATGVMWGQPDATTSLIDTLKVNPNYNSNSGWLGVMCTNLESVYAYYNYSPKQFLTSAYNNGATNRLWVAAQTASPSVQPWNATVPSGYTYNNATQAVEGYEHLLNGYTNKLKTPALPDSTGYGQIKFLEVQPERMSDGSFTITKVGAWEPTGAAKATTYLNYIATSTVSTATTEEPSVRGRLQAYRVWNATTSSASKIWRPMARGHNAWIGHRIAVHPSDSTKVAVCNVDWKVLASSSRFETGRPVHPSGDVASSKNAAYSIFIDSGGVTYLAAGMRDGVGNGTVWSNTNAWTNPGGWTVVRDSANQSIIESLSGTCGRTFGLAKMPNGNLIVAINPAGSGATARKGGLYYKTSSGAWTVSNIGPTQWPNNSAATGQTCPIVPAPGAPWTTSHVYAYSEEHGLYRSTNSGVSWTLIWAKVSNQRHTTSLSLDPLTANRIALTVDGVLYIITNANDGTLLSGGGPGTGAIRQSAASVTNVQQASAAPDGKLWVLTDGVDENRMKTSTNWTTFTARSMPGIEHIGRVPYGMLVSSDRLYLIGDGEGLAVSTIA
jgi:hypothetical protein